jgi:hypothetical protein
MTDLETLVEKWSKEAGLLLTAPCLPELWKNFARLAIQYAAAKAADEYLQTMLKAGRFLGEGVARGCPAYIRERFKAL